MKRSSRKVAAFAALASLFFCAVAGADPIRVVWSPYGGWTARPDVTFLIATVGLAAEWLVIRFFFRKAVRLRRLFAAFVVINLITFPLACLLTLGLGIFAELLPLIAEPLMYRVYFRRIQVAPSHVVLKVVGANLASFAVGVIISISTGYVGRF